MPFLIFDNLLDCEPDKSARLLHMFSHPPIERWSSIPLVPLDHHGTLLYIYNYNLIIYIIHYSIFTTTCNFSAWFTSLDIKKVTHHVSLLWLLVGLSNGVHSAGPSRLRKLRSNCWSNVNQYSVIALPFSHIKCFQKNILIYCRYTVVWDSPVKIYPIASRDIVV